MSDDFLIESSSALNTTIHGTSGKFKISASDGGPSSAEVRYLLTHATLTDQGSNAQLMRMLRPVREVFKLEDLDFDEIMQRDINDARVAQELIPYLLDTNNSGQVKLFPPIVAVVVPLSPMDRRPAKLYEPVTEDSQDVKNRPNLKRIVLTSGVVGREHFSFEFYKDLATGRELESQASLKLAGERCALAIVDGQHRAMALLALFRNLKSDWNDADRLAYAEYYKIWPRSEIEKFKLDELQLPIIICTFPGLDQNYHGDLDVVSAARRVFLTLNKNARHVSPSRNQLLDDNDIVSECLRSTLQVVKNYDEATQSSLRIWNMELDQEGEASKIDSEVALSGVSHLYYIAQFLLFNTAAVRGAKALSTRGKKPTKLNAAFSRLGLDEDLTQEQREASRRDNYTGHVAEIVAQKWEERYGGPFLELLSKFHPLKSFADATLNLRLKLRNDSAIKTESLLFLGQSNARSYKKFREMLDGRRRDDVDSRWRAPHMEEVSRVFGAEINACEKAIAAMRAERAKRVIDLMSKPAKKKFSDENGYPLPTVVSELDSLYSDVFTSVAFQAALLVTLVELVERPSLKKGTVFAAITPQHIEKYLEQLHTVFLPNTEDRFKRFLALFSGDLQFQDDKPVIVRTAASFRSLVYTAEMKPDAFPVYRYVFMELIDRASWEDAEDLEKEILETREEILRSIYDRELVAECQSLNIPPEKSSNEVRVAVLDRSKVRYEHWLHAITGRKVDLKVQHKVISDRVLIGDAPSA